MLEAAGHRAHGATARRQTDRLDGPGGGGLGRGHPCAIPFAPMLRIPEQPVNNRPEVMIAAAQNKFDGSGNLTDQAARDFVVARLTAFKAWVPRLR
jgi:hypothetical protein